ncbi:MAG: acetylornithine transaminase [Dehalococcoidales bacterium]|nr:acetylornithine transaminase [Dehalococcoidales bacterium]
MSNWIEQEQKYYMGVSKRLPIVLVRGEGVRVWDENGESYLDLVAGIAASLLGHAHPAVVNAICRQAGELIHVSNLYYTIPQLELAKLLVDNSAGNQVFFANSGAEANEGAIKLARKYGKLKRDGAYEIISAMDSFHGRTLATVAATGQPKFQKPFEPMPAGFKIVPYNDIGALKAATTKLTAGVLLEVVQGESGVHPASSEYLRAVRQWCDEQNLLLIFDEVQTGMGRTGKFLAYEHYGIEPDIITMAKGLAGGVPIGAFLAKQSASVFELSDHGSTFGGNPLACAAGVATMRTLFEEGLIARAATVGTYLLGRLEEMAGKFPSVAEVRGLGLMAAFDLKEEQAAQVVNGALQHGVILNNTGPRTVRMVPPLILGEPDVDEAIAAISETLAELA